MSEYQVAECTLCGYYYMIHLGACPNCYPEQASNSSAGLVVAIASPKLSSERETIRKELKDAGLLGGDFELPQESKALEALGITDLPPVVLKKGRKDPSTLERDFLIAWQSTGWPMPEQEYRFHHKRKWRFDFCWSSLNLAVELEGGLYSHGRHNRAGGYIADLEKYNTAAELGYTVLRYHQVDNDMLEQVKRVYLKRLSQTLGELDA